MEQTKTIRPGMKNMLGFVLGAMVFVLIAGLRPDGLSADGVMCFGLSMAAVVWWATSAMAPGFAALLLLLGYTLLTSDHVPGSVVFGMWNSPTMYLVIGGFLIARAVESCGLGKRISLWFVQRFVHSYTSVIVTSYVLQFVLSFFVPQPWPRSFLILSIMNTVIVEANLEGKYAENVAFSVFAASVPASMILLTGDSSLNPMVAAVAGVEISYLQWMLYMGVPGILASVLTCLVQLKLFGGPSDFVLDGSRMDQELKAMGRLGSQEKKVLAVLVITVLLWVTDSVTGLNPGWVAVIGALLLALPGIDVLKGDSFHCIPLGTLLFLCAAVAIGSVGNVTGMNEWLADKLFPVGLATGMVSFAAVAVGFCMILHMCLGSTLAVLSIAGPTVVACGARLGVNPLFCGLLAYSCIALHWFLPFHHMSILVGLGEDNGGYTAVPVRKMGLYQTLVVVLVAVLSAGWWRLMGL